MLKYNEEYNYFSAIEQPLTFMVSQVFRSGDQYTGCIRQMVGHIGKRIYTDEIMLRVPFSEEGAEFEEQRINDDPETMLQLKIHYLLLRELYARNEVLSGV